MYRLGDVINQDIYASEGGVGGLPLVVVLGSYAKNATAPAVSSCTRADGDA